jgi:peptidoglycan/LPS O-acetylase OafA/YrhL
VRIDQRIAGGEGTEVNATSNHVAPLTGARALAAGTVVLFHYVVFARHLNGSALPWLTWLVGDGQIPVTIFFVLSGFLLAVRYGEMPLREAPRFVLRRILRIYPLFFVVTLLFCIAPQVLIDGSTVYADVWRTAGVLTMGQALHVDLFGLGAPTGWTLTLELIFYASAPVLFALLRGTARRRIVVLAALLAVIAAGAAATLHWPALYEFSGYAERQMYTVGVLVRLPEFVIGAAVGMHRRAAGGAGGGGERVRTTAMLCAMTCIALIAASNQAFWLHADAGNMLIRWVLAAVFAVLLHCWSVDATKTVGAQWLSTPALVYLGASSFALYLVHTAWPLQWVWRALAELPLPALVLAPLMYGISAAAGAVVYEWVEKPLGRLARGGG